MKEFKEGPYRSDSDHRTAYDGRFRRLFDTDQLERGVRRLPVLNRIPAEVYILAAGILVAGGALTLRFRDQIAQQISVLESRGNMRKEEKSPSAIDELIRARETYNARAEACFRTGRCDDPKAAEIWQKMKEAGYYDGLILTIPENPDGSPAKITLPESVRLLRMPGSCGLPDQNIIAGGLQEKVVPTTQRYEVRKADGKVEGVYLLIDQSAFSKNSKPVPMWIETKPRNC